MEKEYGKFKPLQPHTIVIAQLFRTLLDNLQVKGVDSASIVIFQYFISI